MSLFAPKKSLGQNFLTSEAAVYKIVKAADIQAEENVEKNAGNKADLVLEIGPGKGVLTKALLAAGAHVIAVEKDHRLIEDLSMKFATEISEGRLTIIEGDALEIKPDALEAHGISAGTYKIVANLPYYITGQFLRTFLSGNQQPTRMVLLLQKEVVDRIIARDKKESLLSISIKVYGEPKKITVVDRGSFSPAPNVDSAVISIENISKTFFDGISEEKFFDVVRAGFAHKRKMLAPNLAGAEPTITTREKINEALLACNISEKIRAEDLTVDQWKNLVQKLST